jgi:hypothetical protein
MFSNLLDYLLKLLLTLHHCTDHVLKMDGFNTRRLCSEHMFHFELCSRQIYFFGLVSLIWFEQHNFEDKG